MQDIIPKWFFRTRVPEPGMESTTEPPTVVMVTMANHIEW